MQGLSAILFLSVCMEFSFISISIETL